MIRSFPIANDLGESPVWCWRTGTLYWTDIRASRIHALSPGCGRISTTEAPDFVASIGLHQDGSLIVGMRNSIARVDPAIGTFVHLQDVEPVEIGNRGNDGRVDREGRFWFGTMSNTRRTPDGSLYVYNGSEIVPVRGSIIVPNSLCWSNNGELMYFADSWQGEIEIWKRCSLTDEYAPAGMLLDKDILPGIPDGAIVDSENCLWNARYGAGCVARISPDGNVLQVIELPTRQVTACALGGPELKTLYITSATQRMDQAQLDDEPDAGALFAVTVEVPGLPEPEFVPVN